MNIITNTCTAAVPVSSLWRLRQIQTVQAHSSEHKLQVQIDLWPSMLAKFCLKIISHRKAV